MEGVRYVTRTVVLEREDAMIRRMFEHEGWRVTSAIYHKKIKPKEPFDIFVFVGGSDVDPSLYKQDKNSKTNSDKVRDYNCCKHYDEMEPTKGFVGICRGAQFLNVMNHGRLWQHVDGHAGGPHDMFTEDGEMILVTSTHHQMMIPGTFAEVLGVAYESYSLEGGNEKFGTPKKFQDIEALYYHKSKSLCFQFHPEYAYGAGTPKDDNVFLPMSKYFFNTVDRLLFAD